jgi:hypothetical protein
MAVLADGGPGGRRGGRVGQACRNHEKSEASESVCFWFFELEGEGGGDMPANRSRLIFNNLEEVKCIDSPKAKVDGAVARDLKGERTAEESNSGLQIDTRVVIVSYWVLPTVSGGTWHKRETPGTGST